MIDVCSVPIKKGAHTSPDEGMCIMPTSSDLERFRNSVRLEPNGCMTWTGTLTPKGYGMFSFGGRSYRAHRFSYALSSDLPDLPLDHLCRNRACVNPMHLEPVTPRENLMRSPIAPARICAEKTHCPQGHPYSGDNLMVRTTGQRECRECGRQETRRYKSANRDAINARRRNQGRVAQ